MAGKLGQARRRLGAAVGRRLKSVCLCGTAGRWLPVAPGGAQWLAVAPAVARRRLGAAGRWRLKLVCLCGTVGLVLVGIWGSLSDESLAVPAQLARLSWPASPYPAFVVAVVLAGRRERMRVLIPYLDLLLDAGLLNEVHIWDYTRYIYDQVWLHTLSERRGYRLKSPSGNIGTGPKDSGWYQIYAHYRDFDCASVGAGPDSVVVVKLDDDIVYIDTAKFGSFVRYVQSRKDMLVVHANIVNNGVAAYYQFTRTPLSRREVSGDLSSDLAVYPELMTTQNSSHEEGIRLVPWPGVARLHELFLKAPGSFGWHDASIDDCVKFKPPHTHFQGRFSINFFGARLASFGTLADFVKRFGSDDEHAVTTEATRAGYKQCMYTPFVVTHLAFMFQPEGTAMLPQYEELVTRTALPVLAEPRRPPPAPDDVWDGQCLRRGGIMRLDHWGDDLPDQPLYDISVQDCEERCAEQAQCMGLVFSYDGCLLRGDNASAVYTGPAPSFGRSMCWLKLNIVPNRGAHPWNCLIGYGGPLVIGSGSGKASEI